MNDLIINKGTVQAHLQVAEGVDKQEFRRFIFEAQYLDLKDLLCDTFYFDLVGNYASEKYQTLLAGGTYTYEDNTYHFEGLEKVLSYFTYARFIIESPIQSSSFGIVRKSSNDSERVSLKELEKLGNKHTERAVQVFKGVETFLNRNTDIYTLWESTNCRTNKETRTELWG